MKRTTLFFIFYLLNALLFGFTGKVVNYNNKPIEGVLVKCRNQYRFTDKEGRYEFFYIAKSDTIFFHKLGYHDRKVLGKNIKKITKLFLLPINLRGIKISETYKKIVPDAKVIKRIKGAKELSQILSEDAEIYVKGANISGGEKTISIGGNLSKHTVVMLDGIVLNDAGKDFDISQIPPEIVDRIEIIKSNSSAVAGSGAIGGVINIITKNGVSDKMNFKTSFGAGSFGKYNFYQQIGFSKGVKINLFAKRETAKNNFSYTYPFSNEKPDSLRKNNDSKIWDLNLNAVYKNFKFTILYNNIYKGLAGTLDKMPMFDKAFIKADKIKIIASCFFKSFNFSPKIYYFSDNTRYTNTKSTIPIYFSKTKTKDKKFGLTINEGGKFLTSKISFYQSFKREIFNFKDYYAEQNSIPDIYRDNFSLSNNFNKRFKFIGFNFILHSVLRFDATKLSDKKRFEHFFSYRVSAKVINSYLFNVPHRFTVVYGNSYSLPSFYDVYWKGDIQTQGNKDLKPEFSKGYELKYKVGYKSRNLTLSYNKSSIKDLIYWYKSVVAWKPGNIANAEISNLSASFEQDYKIITMKISYTKTKALDKTILPNGEESIYYNKKLIYVPNYKTNCELKFDFDYFKLTLDYAEIGKRWVTRDNLWGSLSEYSVLNADIEINKNLWESYSAVFNFAVNNIFDKRYDKYQLMPGPGINFEMNFTIQKK